MTNDNECNPPKRIKKEGSVDHQDAVDNSLSLMWFRSDLRISDNPALYNAFTTSKGKGVAAVYIISEKEMNAHEFSPCKVDLILRTLRSLQKELWESFNIPLYIKNSSFLPRKFGEYPPDEIPEDSDDSDVTPFVLFKLCKDIGAKTVCFNLEYEVDEACRDKAVTEFLSKKGLSVRHSHDQCIAPPGTILTKEQKPYTVFTPFRSSWYKYIEANPSSIVLSKSISTRNSHKLPPPNEVPVTIPGFEVTDPEMTKTIRARWPADSESVHKLLTAFVKERIRNYKDKRDLPAVDGTSCLSPYLAIGSLSIRECIHAAITDAGSSKPNPKLISNGNQGIVTWISELCWRDFYRQVIFFFPRVVKGKPFKLTSDYVKWRNDPEGFQRWCAGKTGYPIVDAGMRQLNSTGWMHNRLRMITAMFLTKHLLIDWRLGESYFMRHLIDGDFASNNGGWQWSASTGTDAQPYFRVFNPYLQSEKNDAAGEFIKKWVPELATVKAKDIHNPFKSLSPSQFSKLNYPKPIVEHEMARKRAIETFKAAYAKDK